MDLLDGVTVDVLPEPTRAKLLNSTVLLALVKSKVSDNAPKLVLLLLFTAGTTEAFFDEVLAVFKI